MNLSKAHASGILRIKLEASLERCCSAGDAKQWYNRDLGRMDIMEVKGILFIWDLFAPVIEDSL